VSEHVTNAAGDQDLAGQSARHLADGGGGGDGGGFTRPAANTIENYSPERATPADRKNTIHAGDFSPSKGGGGGGGGEGGVEGVEAALRGLFGKLHHRAERGKGAGAWFEPPKYSAEQWGSQAYMRRASSAALLPGAELGAGQSFRLSQGGGREQTNPLGGAGGAEGQQPEIELVEVVNVTTAQPEPVEAEAEQQQPSGERAAL
jgi:hypothetical protein